MTHFPLRRCLAVKSVYPAHLLSMRIRRISLRGAIRHYVFATETEIVLRAHILYRRKDVRFFGRDRRRIRHRLRRVIKMERPRTYDLYLGHRRRPTAMAKVYPKLSPDGQQIREVKLVLLTELNVEENPPAYCLSGNCA